MENSIFQWILDIPRVVASFGEWLATPIYQPYITVTPLELFGIGGVGVIITLIGVHVVRLFV